MVELFMQQSSTQPVQLIGYFSCPHLIAASIRFHFAKLSGEYSSWITLSTLLSLSLPLSRSLTNLRKTYRRRSMPLYVSYPIEAVERKGNEIKEEI